MSDPAARSRPVPVAVAAITTAGWAAVVGAAPVVAVALIAWIADSRSAAPALDAVRLAVNGWLLAHGVGLETLAGPFGLAPLALTILAFRQLSRAGANSARATGIAGPGGAVRVMIWIGLVYGGLGALAALLAHGDGLHADVAPAGLRTGAFAIVAAASGIVRVNGIGGSLMRRLPLPLRRAVPLGALSAGVILGAGALLAGVCVALAAEETAMLFTAFSPGLVGSASLLGLSVLYAPTAVVWSASYLVGPGFAIGSGTTVSAIDVSLGPLPAFPLFAALPTQGASDLAVLLLGVPLLAGVLGGVAAARARPQGERWVVTLAGAALSGPIAGLLLGAAAYAASGPLGGGRLAVVGPSAWRVALVAAIEVSLSAVVGAAVMRIVYAISGRVPTPVRSVAQPVADADAPHNREAHDHEPHNREAHDHEAHDHEAHDHEAHGTLHEPPAPKPPAAGDDASDDDQASDDDDEPGELGVELASEPESVSGR